MNDSTQIDNLVNVEPQLAKYASKEWRYIEAIGSGNITDGYIRHDTLQQINEWCIWSNGYIDADFTLTGVSNLAGEHMDVGQSIALRNGVASLIHSTLVQINNVTISNNTEVAFMEHIRSVLQDHTFGWEKSHGREMHQSLDRMDPDDVYHVNILTNENVAVAEKPLAQGAEPDFDNEDLYNQGFNQRQKDFRVSARFVAGVDGVSDASWTVNVRIPLKMINKVFEAMDMPLSNLRIQTTIGLTAPGLTTNKCYVMETPVTANGIAQATLNLGVSVTPHRPRLYFEVVQFDGPTWNVLEPLLDPAQNPEGRMKRFKFMDHKAFYVEQAVGPNASFSYQITPGMRNVKRVYVIPQAKSKQNLAFVSALENGKDVGYHANIALKNINLQVDNKNFFPTNIQYDHEAYQLLKEAMGEDGRYGQEGLLSYQDFKTNYHYYVFDIQRNPNVVLDSAKPVSLYLTATRAINAQADYTSLSNPLDPRSYLMNTTAPGPPAPPIVPVDLRVFVEYEVDMMLNLIDGKVSVNNQ